MTKKDVSPAPRLSLDDILAKLDQMEKESSLQEGDLTLWYFKKTKGWGPAKALRLLTQLVAADILREVEIVNEARSRQPKRAWRINPAADPAMLKLIA